MPTKLLRTLILALAIALSSVSAPATEAPTIRTLGPHDEITVHVAGSDEVSNTPIRIGPDGYINIPFAGRFLAAGATVEDLEIKIAAGLARYLREPQVSVSIERVQSRPVTVLGAVRAPGVLQVEGQKTLLEVLSLAGGVRDDSGYQIKIVRRQQVGPLDLPGAAPDETGRFYVAEVDLAALMEAEHPEYNIFVQPHDVITVPRARMVFVIGEVTRAGGFALSERESVSVLQALALAGGLGHSPALRRAKILRPIDDAPRKQEIALDLKSIMAGTAADVELLQDDILFVPKSGTTAAAKAAARAAVSIGSGITIWRVGNR
ncbi:MAG: polysaccharide export protein [Acidobacteria bacterium]|nr:polysaccharide export protein [Acidobacteriota bacterium]